MHEFTLEFLKCIRCGGKLSLEILHFEKEIDEGFLECHNCKLIFPIIEKIPILWDDFSIYLSYRKTLGGKLYRSSNSQKMKIFLKSSLQKIKHTHDDRTLLEERWSKIYQNSRNSKFYSLMKKNLDSLGSFDFVLEHGCSIGIMTSHLRKSNKIIFGVDRSFSALKHAKINSKSNLDYILADSLSPIFGKLKFNLILGFNVLELIEPVKFLKTISKQMTSGYLVLTDPYDFDRGVNSVKNPLNESSLRTNLENLGFKISKKTRKPSFIPWILNLNPRATLNYKVDLIIGKK